MVETILSLPYFWAALSLFFVACFRAQCTYWLGRALRAGLLKSERWRRTLESEAMARGQRAIIKWGWPIIPLSFLTMGFQSAVQAGAGILGWSWGRYTLAALPGYVLWGCVYAAGGLAAFAGFVRLASVSWWLVALASLALIGLVVLLVLRRRRREALPA